MCRAEDLQLHLVNLSVSALPQTLGDHHHAGRHRCLLLSLLAHRHPGPAEPPVRAAAEERDHLVRALPVGVTTRPQRRCPSSLDDLGSTVPEDLSAPTPTAVSWSSCATSSEPAWFPELPLPHPVGPTLTELPQPLPKQTWPKADNAGICLHQWRAQERPCVLWKRATSPGSSKPGVAGREENIGGRQGSSYQLRPCPAVTPGSAPVSRAASPVKWREGLLRGWQRPFLEFFNFLTHLDVKFLKILKQWENFHTKNTTVTWVQIETCLFSILYSYKVT